MSRGHRDAISTLRVSLCAIAVIAIAVVACSAGNHADAEPHEHAIKPHLRWRGLHWWVYADRIDDGKPIACCSNIRRLPYLTWCNWGIVMTAASFDWAAFFAACQKAVADIEANRAPPVSAQSVDVAALLTTLQTELPSVIAALNAHQGVITGADDILAVLSAEGLSWAGEAEAALDAAPGALTAAASWLPTIAGLLQAFSPAPANDPVSPNSPTDFSRGR